MTVVLWRWHRWFSQPYVPGVLHPINFTWQYPWLLLGWRTTIFGSHETVAFSPCRVVFVSDGLSMCRLYGEVMRWMLPICDFFWCRCYRCAVNYWDETSHEHLPFGGVPLPMGGKSSFWKNSTHRYCFHMSINLVVVLSLTDSARFFCSSCNLSVSSSPFRFLSITL